MVYSSYKVTAIKGRYLPCKRLIKVLELWDNYKQADLIGTSVLGENIPVYTIGTGTKKVLIWSQMHGNESTTTKALLDFMAFLISDHTDAKALLKGICFTIIPMLNPDGANAYTRLNANLIDLNRDFKALSQPESRFLVDVFERVQPDFCFNLHDQRTIFSVGSTAKSASLSFLAPAADTNRTITPSRLVSMQLIAAINEPLQLKIPEHIGRYDDSFNENCAGDHFQSLGVPTLLFEAGHYHLDYQRETTREWVYLSLLEAFKAVLRASYFDFSATDYLRIPENQKNHLDILVKNPQFLNPLLACNRDLSFQFEECLEDNEIAFYPKQIDLEIDKTYFFHETIDFSVKLTPNQTVVSHKISRELSS